MFNVYVDDGNLNLEELDDICYIINKQGTFLRKKVGITDALVKVNNISHLKSSLSCFGKIDIPLIPSDDIRKITKFFKWAYKEHNGESVVLIYYNPELQDFDIYPTNQEVSQASASYVKEGLSHTGYLLTGTIHSHANFGASHSGVDNNDELNFDGVHITIGNVNDTYQSISCSIVVNGNRFMYDPEKYIDGIIKVNYNQNSKTNQTQKFVKSDRYLVKGLTFSEFPEEWKDKVQKRIKPHYKNRGSVFDSYLYKKYGYDIENSNGRLKRSDIITLEDNKHIKHDNKDNSSPCDNCIYKNHKSEKLVQEILNDDQMSYLFLDNIEIEDDEDDDFYNFTGGDFN